MPLPRLDDLFTTQEQRDEQSYEKIKVINIKNIVDFPNHPFKVKDEELDYLKSSIDKSGITNPVLVREKSNGYYEMISGHRRKRTSELLGLDTIPAIVRDLTDDIHE